MLLLVCVLLLSVRLADAHLSSPQAQAYIRVTLTSGGELLFCAHHGRAHESKLREVSVDFQDDSSRLAETPAVAPETER